MESAVDIDLDAAAETPSVDTLIAADDPPAVETAVLEQRETRRVLGGGVVGAGAGELIAELAFAVENLALTVHPHPTLSETFGLAAEADAATITDLRKRRAR